MDISSALIQWRACLGNARVNHHAYGAGARPSTDPLGARSLATLHVRDELEVIACVQIARSQRVSIHPISTGRNWGYGTANPGRSDCVLLNMADMCEIGVDNADLGVFSLEPGVTQGQLNAFLREKDLPFLTPTTGAGPDCSIVANALERGYGITPITDHFASVMALRAVMADGSVYRSPLDAVGAQASNGLFKWGYGPYWDGLFAQGHIGIVTRMHVALIRRPARIAMLSFSSQDRVPADQRAAQIEPLVEATREVIARLPGCVASVNLMNQRRVLAVADDVRAVNAPSVYDYATVDAMARRLSIAAWTGVGSLYGEREMVDAAKKVIKRCLSQHTKRLILVTQPRLNVLASVRPLLPARPRAAVSRVMAALSKGLDILNGEPNRVAHGALYWALRRSFDPDAHTDPAAEGVGLLWYVPLIPARGAQAREIIAEIERVCFAYAFEPLITLTAISERCFDSSIPIVFDANDSKRAHAAHRCYDALLQAGLARGVAPYRFGAHANATMLPGDAKFVQLGNSLRSSVDPGFVLAPGRYEVLS
jgi:hypothetical protein